MDAIITARVHEVVADVLRRRDLDHRTCYTHVLARPPQGRLVVECSMPDISDEIRRELDDRLEKEAEAIEHVVLPPDGLPELSIAVSSVVDVRREPAHTSELLTQVIYGESMTPLKVEGDWYLVRLEDGYVGWIRSWHLKVFSGNELTRYRDGARHRVVGNIIQVFKAPDESAFPVTDAVVGTRIRVSDGGKRGWRRVELPDGKTGFVRASGIGSLPRSRRVSRERLAATGMRFLGIPYLWGGTTPKGFDCSGLTQRILQLHGILIPRDSDMQARFGRPRRSKGLKGLKTGDLLFFGKSAEEITHVAMYLSDGLFLHAYGQVRVGALDPRHPLFEAKLLEDLRGTRDPL